MSLLLIRIISGQADVSCESRQLNHNSSQVLLPPLVTTFACTSTTTTTTAAKFLPAPQPCITASHALPGGHLFVANESIPRSTIYGRWNDIVSISNTKRTVYTLVNSLQKRENYEASC